jgi:hypothetical protein
MMAEGGFGMTHRPTKGRPGLKFIRKRCGTAGERFRQSLVAIATFLIGFSIIWWSCTRPAKNTFRHRIHIVAAGESDSAT